MSTKPKEDISKPRQTTWPVAGKKKKGPQSLSGRNPYSANNLIELEADISTDHLKEHSLIDM
jgi:hypothetical protein